DRMDGRQVYDVEPELSDVWQHPLRVAEGAVPLRVGRGRAGKKFVPGAEDGAIALGEDAQVALEPAGDGAIRMSRCRGEQTRIDGRGNRGGGLAAEQGLLSLPQPLRIRPGSAAFRPRRRGVEQRRALEQLGGHLSPDLGLALDRIAPAVDLRLHVFDDRAPPALGHRCLLLPPAPRDGLEGPAWSTAVRPPPGP